MSTPTLAHKTTISSRSKINQLNGGRREILEAPIATATTIKQNRFKQPVSNNMQPQSLIARNRLASKTPAHTIETKSTSRLASLANGFPSSLKNGTQTAITKATNHNIPNKTSTTTTTATNNGGIPFTPKTSTTNVKTHTIQTVARPAYQQTTTTTRLPPSTSIKTDRSTLTSVTNTLKRPLSREGIKPTSQIPDTNSIRRGLAKFSNPMECQRQFQALSSKIQSLDETLEARDKKIAELQVQLERALNTGVGYATTVQYLAAKLKLDSEVDLTKECAQLKERVSGLLASEMEHESKIETIISDYKNHLQVELDLRNNLEKELEDAHKAHSELVERLNKSYKEELDDLNEQHSTVQTELRLRIESLEAELETKTNELVELRKEHEVLTNNFNKLEESLTKDKDARVKYAQEKINQLQKDVDSLNSVLEMKTEKIHSLERDSLLLTEAQNDLVTHKDTIKALNQQLESVNAALDKKREQFENLMVENEKLRQELKRERKERRRLTMKSEQLEYVLNESCASESNMVFNSTIRDVDNDQLI